MKQKYLPNPAQTEWDYARAALSKEDGFARLSQYVEKHLQHDFMKIDDVIYALANKPLGRGGYGKVLWVENEKRERLVCKMTFPEGVYNEMPFPEFIFKRMGFIKGVTGLNDYEQETLFSLGLAIQGTFEEGSHITVMRPLGLPLADYIAQNEVDQKKAISLALKTVRALYDFHTGFSDKKGRRRLHNDIKPGNVLIDPEKKSIALIDFSECFDINEYEPLKVYRHPRPTSFEPFIAAPEVRYQTGLWYKPWQQYRHTNRLLSVQSDVYLLGSVLKPLAKKNKILGHIRMLIMHPDRNLRPTEPILLIVLMVLSDEFNQAFEAFKTSYHNQLPGFDGFLILDEMQAKAIATCFFISDKKQIYYHTDTLLRVLKDKALCKQLAKQYPLCIEKTRDNRFKVEQDSLSDRLKEYDGRDKLSAIRA